MQEYLRSKPIFGKKDCLNGNTHLKSKNCQVCLLPKFPQHLLFQINNIMKLNIIPCFIAMILCAIIAFAMYTWCRYADMRLLLSIFGGICLLLPLGTMLGVSMPNSGIGVNIKILSIISFAILLASHIVFCFLSHFTAASYIIVNSLLETLWLLVAYAISKS